MYKCKICDKELSNSASYSSHMRKHVRDKSVKEIKNKAGKLEWIPTGKKPQNINQQKREKENKFLMPLNCKKIKIEPRTKITAKFCKNQIQIKCRICEKYENSNIFVDERFISINHCEKLSLFPTRIIEKLKTNKNIEYTE